MSSDQPAPARHDSDRGAPVCIEVERILESGECSFGIEVGRSWVVDSPGVPEGMCMWAWAALVPFLTPLRFGGSLPWEDTPGTARVCCPDPGSPVVFRLTAL